MSCLFLISCNITISWLHPLGGIRFTFLLRDSENDLFSLSPTVTNCLWVSEDVYGSCTFYTGDKKQIPVYERFPVFWESMFAYVFLFPESIAWLKSVFLPFWENHMQSWSVLGSISGFFLLFRYLGKSKKRERGKQRKQHWRAVFVKRFRKRDVRVSPTFCAERFNYVIKSSCFLGKTFLK